jgi:hypothetical protein
MAVGSKADPNIVPMVKALAVLFVPGNIRRSSTNTVA